MNGTETRAHYAAPALQSISGGLRALNRTLELPITNPLKSAHEALDNATLAAYNFPHSLIPQSSPLSPPSDLLAQLLALNLQLAANIAANIPVTPPGIPPTYGDTQTLITVDCITP